MKSIVVLGLVLSSSWALAAASSVCDLVKKDSFGDTLVVERLSYAGDEVNDIFESKQLPNYRVIYKSEITDDELLSQFEANAASIEVRQKRDNSLVALTMTSRQLNESIKVVFSDREGNREFIITCSSHGM